MSLPPFQVDGSLLEGGGQLLRVAFTLAALLGRPIVVTKIRAARPKTGLRPQHLEGVRLVADLCHGHLEGAKLGSEEVCFHPGALRAGTFCVDTGTAGSITLLHQIALPCLLFAPGVSQLTLRGGTNVEFAPSIDSTRLVLQPLLSRMGVEQTMNVERRGFFPKGGGIVHFNVSPLASLHPLTLMDRGDVERVDGICFVAGKFDTKFGQRMVDSALGELRGSKDFHHIPIDVQVVRETPRTAYGDGAGLIMVARTSTGCLLEGAAPYTRGMTVESVGATAAHHLMANIGHGGCVDEWTQDQLILPMALAKGTSRIRCGPVTMHTRTMIHFVGQIAGATVTMTPVTDGKGGDVIMEVIGLGKEKTE